MSGLIYKLLRGAGMQPLLRALTSEHPKILMYHRVLDDNGASGAISPGMLREQFDLLCRHFQVLPLDVLLEKHRRGVLPRHSIALTFDDGYVDFAEHAWPALRDYGLPATLYVTTGFVDRHLWMWPDVLRYALTSTAHTTWSSNGGERFLLPRDAQKAWHAAADLALVMPNDTKWDFVREVCIELGVALPDVPLAHYSAVTWDQLSGMDSELVQIGSHTVTHPILSRLSPDRLRFELVESKRRIEECLGREVTGFCYPNGMPADISPSVVEGVKAAGYRHACLAYPARQPVSTPFLIKRYPVGHNMLEFESVVDGYRYLGLR